MNQVSIIPSTGRSVKVLVESQGPFWVATAHVVMPGQSPKIVKARIDKRPFVKAFEAFQQEQRLTGRPIRFGHYHVTQDEFGTRVAGHDAVVGRRTRNIFKRVSRSVKKNPLASAARVLAAPVMLSYDAARLANKASKLKVLENLEKGVKTVVKSRYAAGVIGVVAVAFPPVGVPAAAAFAAANLALANLEKAKMLKSNIERAVKSGNKKLVKYYKRNLGSINKIIASADKVQSQLKHMGAAAKSGNPTAVRDAKIFAIVQAAREKQKRALGGRKAHTLGNAVPGMLVTSSGKVVTANWLLSPEAKAQRGLLVTTKNGARVVEPGRFLTKIGQDVLIGCNCGAWV